MNQINLICLGVQNLESSREFYKALGFEEPKSEQADVIVFFNNTGTKLELFPYTELLKDIGLDPNQHPAPQTFNGNTFAYNVHSSEEVDEVFALAQKAGAKIVKKPVWGDWGGYSGYFTDPDGYYWEVTYGPNWRFDLNGMLIID